MTKQKRQAKCLLTWNRFSFRISAFWMVLSCVDMTDSTETSMRLNSSKQPHAPHWHRPEKIFPTACNTNRGHDLLILITEIITTQAHCQNTHFTALESLFFLFFSFSFFKWWSKDKKHFKTFKVCSHQQTNLAGSSSCSNLVFYAQSTSSVISGQYTFCHHITIVKSVYMLKLV